MGNSDKDARDLRDMEVEKRLTLGGDLPDMSRGGVGGFERHTKGIGSKLLKKSGWTEGSGVGVGSQGISEPLEAEGQHPHSKKGLGYELISYSVIVYSFVILEGLDAIQGWC